MQLNTSSFRGGVQVRLGWAWFIVLLLPGLRVAGADAAAQFRKEIQPILTEYCSDCHADGAKKGNVAFDELKSDAALLDHDLWLKVLKNTRAGLMPPEKKPKPSAEERAKLEQWIKYSAFGIDPKNPDPGRVTVRRLNRVEYRNTIRDLTGHDFRVEEELPPDDTGYGFDNIGDVLSISPLLLEKYMQAAEVITATHAANAVPRVTRVVAEKAIPGTEFRKAEGKGTGERMSFYDEAKVAQTFKAEHAGSYHFVLEVEVLGQFDFDPGTCQVIFKAGDKELWQKEFGWQAGKKFKFEFDDKWEAGEHPLTLELKPLTPLEDKKNSLDLRINTVRVQGPTEEKHWVRPKNFELFFTKDPPQNADERRIYARDVLSRFTKRAYRRPVDERTIDRLLSIAETAYAQPGKRFEDGIAQAIVPILASPRFLFRIEDVEPGSSKSFATVDEHALATRLSYFLWSTMPDDELFGLADRGELRKNFSAQVKRMLADKRSDALVQNFVGQWLQTRDVEGIDINSRAVLARDSGQEREVQNRRQRFQELNAIADEKQTPEQKAELEAIRATFRNRRGRLPQIELDRDLRRAMREETEMAFGYVVRANRSVLDLLDADYTFLNEKLAKHYNLTNLDVTGPEMRRVALPIDSPRGGVLTHGAALVVTSNPTRTSPVKRGLFILDNILGLPTPPPPPDIPNLEDSEKEAEGRKPTLREVLAIHREQPLCASCHNRMDPLGLALENFNALGMWREKERNQAIDAAGKLITGEEFHDIRDVKRVLATKHRRTYYQCLTEKLLTYALGRGLEYYDVEAVDRIVDQLDQDNGRFSALLTGIVESVPFQKRRNISSTSAAAPASDQRADIK
jgi:mono/diheme cytochrome c family protein